MSESKPAKSKFRLGQKVWYIGNGYVCNEVIKTIFVDKLDSINYGFETIKYGDNIYSVNSEDMQDEGNVYATQAELIKSIKDTEYD